MYGTVPMIAPASVASGSVAVGSVSSGCGCVRLELRQSEVEDLGQPAPGDEQVLRLEVPVDDPLLVGHRQTPGDLHAVIRSLGRIGSAPRDRLCLSDSPSSKLSDQVGSAALAAHVIDNQDVGMVQLPGRLGFLLEPPQPARV